MNARYSRQYYSTPHYAPHETSPTIFGEKPHALPRTTRARIRLATRCRNRVGEAGERPFANAIDSRELSERQATASP